MLLDFEGRQISPDWLDVPEKVVLALLRHGVVPGEDRHLLFRVPNPWLEQDEEKISKILASVARANILFLLACERLGIEPTQNAIYEITVPQVNSSAEIGAVVKIGTLYRQAADGLFEAAGEQRDEFLVRRVPAARRAALLDRVLRVRLVPLCENVGALAHLPDLLEAFYLALERGRGAEDLPDARHLPHSLRPRGGNRPRVRGDVRHGRAERQDRHRRRLALAIAGREEAERRLAVHAKQVGEPAPSVTFLVGAGRAGFRGGFDPAHHGVLRQFARADGVTLQGIRADAPAGTDGSPPRSAPRSRRGRRSLARSCRSPTPSRCRAARGRRPGAHRDAAAHRAAHRAVRRPRAADARADPRDGLGELRPLDPEYPEEWGGGTTLPDNRDLRDAWPEGVTLPRAIVYNLACTTLGLPAVTSDLAALDQRAAVLLDRHAPGYREIVASELPLFVQESVGARVRQEARGDGGAPLPARRGRALGRRPRRARSSSRPTCLFAMLYLRYLAEDSDSWDETKEHESLTTRDEELDPRDLSSAFGALCAETARRPLAGPADARGRRRRRAAAARARADHRGEARVRGPAHRGLAARRWPTRSLRELRREWSRLRELAKDELTLDAIEQARRPREAARERRGVSARRRARAGRRTRAALTSGAGATSASACPGSPAAS